VVHLLILRRFTLALPTTLILCGLAACAIDRAGLRVDEDAAVRDGNVADAADMGRPPGDAGCTRREVQCGGECVDPFTDPLHCGSCDACPARAGATSTCTDGACGFACETGFTDCDGDAANGCEADIVSDPLTCGGCGRPCPMRFGTTPRCTDSACTYDCGGGLSDCDGSEANGCETNTTSDPLHCGSCAPCADRAGTTASCGGGVCAYACVAGSGDCDGDRSNGCEADLSAPATCGSCTNVCAGAPGASATCGASGMCGIACDAARANCDGNPSNGCEVDTGADEANCGGCGVPCTGTPGTVATCTLGTCTLTCAGGRLECDGNTANGCEVDPTADPLHCGSCAPCSAVAGATSGCSAGACTYACAADFRDCDGAAANGCEIDVRSSPTHCGSCGTICAPPANASASCAARVCGFSCTAPFGDCDGLAGNGCERNTSSDVLNCGACGTACAASANATTTCTSRMCGYSCTAPFSDCDGVASNGCERNTQTDAMNCGACGSACAALANATPTCTATGCGYACIAPFVDCNGLAADGCERNTQTDIANCGSCGTICPGRANAMTSCGGTGCGFSCAMGFDDCDALPATGCEVLLATTAAHCGLCGNACATGRSCVASTCQGWTPVSPTAAPGARTNHTAVWTGTEMIVWGGENSTAFLGDGGRYNPTTNAWTAMSATGAPSGRRSHTAVWTGTEMIVWGGYGATGWVNTGARYNPSTNAWTAMSTTSAPGARSRHAAVWTGSRMLVWGGWTAGGGGDSGDGASYDPATNTWTALTGTNAPSDRRWHTGIAAGARMIVWGGETGGGAAIGDGKRYDFASGVWTNISTTADPAGRARHSSVWTGTYLLVWGGDDGDGAGVFGTARADGGRYDPAADTWAGTAGAALVARARHTAVWSGTRMLVWGGGASTGTAFGDGAAYDPTGTGSWVTLSAVGAPSARQGHTAVWTGAEMIVWGGSSAAGAVLADGARLIP